MKFLIKILFFSIGILMGTMQATSFAFDLTGSDFNENSHNTAANDILKTVIISSHYHGNVKLTRNEVLKAYTELSLSGKSKRYKEIRVNDDGSSSIVEPRFLFNGEELPFDTSHLMEICRFFGFTEFVTFTKDSLFFNTNAVTITPTGDFQAMVEKDVILESITCK